eukprot:COSAG04_NODE_4661_length_1960_cov_46.084363_2_plen_178_part_00
MPRKKQKSAYSFFATDKSVLSKLKTANPDASAAELTKLKKQQWKELSESEREQFIDAASADQLRYKNELVSLQGKRPADEMASEDDEEYEVEEILAKRTAEGGRIEFRVRWKNFGEEADTWEPRSNLVGSEQLLLEFCDREVREAAQEPNPAGDKEAATAAPEPTRKRKAAKALAST